MIIDDWVGHNIPEVVLDDAASWMALLDSERCNAADRMAFARWLDEDPCHQWAFEELSEVWARLHTLADVRPLLAQSNVVKLPGRHAQTPAAPAPKPRSDWTALAASLLVMIGVAAHYLTVAPVQIFETVAGETTVITLEDGTRAELNVTSSIDVNFMKDARDVRLNRGDAIFHIAKGARPFTVKTELGKVLLAGTNEASFAISAGQNRLQVAVLDGEVSVEQQSTRQPLTVFDDAVSFVVADRTAKVRAGEAIELRADGRGDKQIFVTNYRQQLSWREGYLEFNEEPLERVVAEMRRYLGLKIHIADAALAKLPISARFDTGDSQAFLEKLNNNQYIMVDNTETLGIILRPRLAFARN